MTAELRSIDFHGEVVFLVAHPENGKPYIPAKPLCEQLGMAWSPQRTKLKTDTDLWGCDDIVIPSPGGPQTMTCLPLDNLNGWLFSIQAARVKPEFRERLRTYQKECFQVLDAYWRTGAAIRPEVRAGAPGATRALFNEIEGMTGLDPEASQPGAGEEHTWLTPGDIGKRLGMCRPTVHARVHDYNIPHRWEGNLMLVAFEPFEQHMRLFPLHPTKGRPGGSLMTPERRWAEGAVGTKTQLAQRQALGGITVREVTPRELMDLYGPETAREVLHRLCPDVFPVGKEALA